MVTNDDSTYVGPAVPRPLGECLRRLLGLDARPRTFGDYVAGMASLVDTRGLDVDLPSLCTTKDSPHRATFVGETHHYQCPLDAFVVPFLSGAPPDVRVRTVCPVSGGRVTFTVTPATIDSHPADAVLSFGVATDLHPSSSEGKPTPGEDQSSSSEGKPTPGEDQSSSSEGQPSATGDSSPVLAYRLVCPYAKAFASRAAYDAWTGDVDAYAMTVTTRDVLELAGALGRTESGKRGRDRSSSVD